MVSHTLGKRSVKCYNTMESQDILLREASHEKMRTTWFHLHAERKEVELRNREVVARC